MEAFLVLGLVMFLLVLAGVGLYIGVWLISRAWHRGIIGSSSYDRRLTALEIKLEQLTLTTGQLKTAVETLTQVHPTREEAPGRSSGDA